MKLKPIINSSRSIKNISHILPRNNSFVSNTSELSVNNVSATTNASRVRRIPNILPKLITPKNNYIIKNVKINNNLKRSSSVTSLSNVYSPSTMSTKSSKKTMGLLENAEQIMRERLKNHGVVLAGGKFLLKSIALRISKEVSQRNYTINLLKEKRTQINEKERIISQALKEFSEQFESDHKKFIDFVEEEKRKQKLEEETMNYIKERREKKEENLNQEGLMKKRLDEMLERKIKEIYALKSYGSFFNKVFDKYFAYDECPKIDNREKNYEKISNKIIEIYEKKDKYEKLPKELDDEELLMKKYLLLEDKIMNGLANKEILDKEILKQKKYFEKEIEQLTFSLNDYESDFIYLKTEKNNVNVEMRNYKIHEDGFLENILDMILELGKEIGTNWPVPISKDKKNLSDFVIYAKKTIDSLKSKEVIINDGITEIENALLYGNKIEKSLMEKSILEQKKINKRDNQLKAKKYLEEIKNQKNLRAIERAQKMVVTGRKVVNLAIFKNKRKIKKIIKKGKDDDIGYIYYATDEEEN
jgi:hypothetical protein